MMDAVTLDTCPLQVLDAPSLQDDFYLNLVDWSSQNVLAVGLGACVYLWSACSSRVSTGTSTNNWAGSLLGACCAKSCIDHRFCGWNFPWFGLRYMLLADHPAGHQAV
jgi:hypothetical protein